LCALEVNSFNAAEARKIMLEVISRLAKGGGPDLQDSAVLSEVVTRLKARGKLHHEQAILTLWYDLFRNGQLSPGYSVGNRYLPQCHVTDAGREMLKHASLDPADPSGYLEHLKQQGPVDPVALSYVEEALHAYNSNCFKAAAVMIGAAAEGVVLEFRGTLVTGIKKQGRKPSHGLEGWLYKKVRDEITQEIDSQKKGMTKEESDAFLTGWNPLTEQLRTTRNDAGHPASIDPVTPENVHASLLMFPGLIRLCTRLTAWVQKHYV